MRVSFGKTNPTTWKRKHILDKVHDIIVVIDKVEYEEVIDWFHWALKQNLPSFTSKSYTIYMLCVWYPRLHAFNGCSISTAKPLNLIEILEENKNGSLAAFNLMYYIKAHAVVCIENISCECHLILELVQHKKSTIYENLILNDTKKTKLKSLKLYRWIRMDALQITFISDFCVSNYSRYLFYPRNIAFQLN